jgi:hypothetical protein
MKIIKFVLNMSLVLYNQLIDKSFACLCGIERKSKKGIHSHIKNVHFGQKIQKKKVDNVKLDCLNCHKTFANKKGLLSHIKKQVCAKDSDIVMGF